MRFASVGRRRSSRSGGQAQAIILIAALLLAILAPILAQMLYFACSRRREYLADATGARLTRYPEGLASALEKISSHAARVERQSVNKVLAPMYIVNPMSALAAGLFSTHPPTRKRVQVLRAMAGGADYAKYEEAYRRVEGKGVLGQKTLASSRPVGLREPTPEVREEKPQDVVERLRQVSTLAGRMDDMVILSCACGVGIRVPPGFRREAVPCPRCGRDNPVPKAAGAQGPMTYRRKGKGWESFRCGRCDRAIQLSPAFSAPKRTCDGCGVQIEIETPAA